MPYKVQETFASNKANLKTRADRGRASITMEFINCLGVKSPTIYTLFSSDVAFLRQVEVLIYLLLFEIYCGKDRLEILLVITFLISERINLNDIIKMFSSLQCVKFGRSSDETVKKVNPLGEKFNF